ncbi:MAG: CheR family methyltransferase [Rhodospirillales bacterium]
MTPASSVTTACAEDRGALSDILNAVHRQTGLAYYLGKDDVLTKKIDERIARLNVVGYRQYLDVLESESGDKEWRWLIDELVVNETYFFRYEKQFKAFKSAILPEYVRSGGPLRIWSAGCACGAEPYSLNLLIRSESPHLSESGRLEILGTDISERNLSRARDGVFTAWELRGMSETYRNQAFEPVGKNWRLRDAFTSGVTFSPLNLAMDMDSFVEGHRNHFDIVFCRNVMIYFDTALIRRVLVALRECLKTGGWLFVGHAEPYLELIDYFDPVPFDGTTVYRNQVPGTNKGRNGMRVTPPASSSPQPEPVFTPAVPEPRLPDVPAPVPVAPPPARVAAVPAAPSPPPTSTPGTEESAISTIRGLANQGDWQKATQECQALIEAAPMDADAHFLLALIAENLGRNGDAVESLKRAIYIDRDHGLAYYHLGLAHARIGNAAAACKALRNVNALVSVRGDDEPVRGGDGLAAGELGEMARTVLTQIGG